MMPSFDLCRTYALCGIVLLGQWAGDVIGAESVGCAIEPNRSVKLSTAVEGVLSEVKVKRGDIVKRGDVVAVLQSGVERASVDLAKARATLRAEIDARQARAKAAERKLRRARELLDQHFVSSEEVDDAETEYEVAKRNYQAAQENQKLAALDVVRAKAQLALRTTASPSDGIVVDTFLSGGEFAQGQPILEIASIDPLHVEVIMPMSAYGKVEPGMTGIVMPEQPLTGEFEAKVAIVDRIVDAASGTFGVRLLLENRSFSLPAGIECQVRFTD